MEMEAIDPFSARQAESDRPEIPPRETALLVVDVINEYVHPDGLMSMPDGDRIVGTINALAGGTRAAGGAIVWIKPGHREAADGLFRKRIVHAITGTWGCDLLPELDVAEGERVLEKRRYSSFFGTDLDLYLREHGIRRVVVCGVALNICVRSTVHDAFFHGYDVWVPSDACMATGPREEASTLYDIQTHFGEVMAADAVLAEWR